MQKYQSICVLPEYPLECLVNMPIDVEKRKIDRFESIVATYIDSVYSFALYMTGNEFDAQDLAQDTYIRAYKRFDDSEDETNYKAWLLKISADALMRYLPQDNIPSHISSVSENQNFTNQLSDNETSIDDILEKKTDDDVAEAIYSLPITYRMILVLAVIEDFSYREISYIIGCPIGVVSSRLHKGYQILREKLQLGFDQYSYQKSGKDKEEVLL